MPFWATTSFSTLRSISDVARASCTARWAFSRLMPSCLHMLPSLWLFSWGYWLRTRASVSTMGNWKGSPACLKALLKKDMSKLALWATSTAPSQNLANSGMTCISVRLPRSMALVMPVISTTRSGTGRPGSISSENSATSTPFSMRTAPISMISSVRVFRPVVSTSSTTYVAPSSFASPAFSTMEASSSIR